MSDDDRPKKRGYTMSDDERAMQRLRRDLSEMEVARVGEDAPTPEHGIQGHDSTPRDIADDRTPYPIDLVTLLSEDPRLDRLARKLWAHASNAELRTNETVKQSGSAAIAERLDALESRIDEAVGVKGDNGKLGKVNGTVKLIRAGLIFTLVSVVGALGASVSAINSAGERDGRNEARIEQNRHDIDRLADQMQQLWTFQFRAPVAPGAHP